MLRTSRSRAAFARLLAIGLGIGAASIATAQTSPVSNSTITVAAEATTTDRKPTVEIGFEERYRSETWNNIIDYSDARDDKRNQFRFRTRLWARVQFGEQVEIYGGLNNESRSVTTPNQPTVLDEIIVEQLYVDWKTTKRSSLRAGRQNLTRGEGFIIFDANPLDGSRSAYFNALLLTRTFGARSTLELIAIDNPIRDRYLPPIHNQNRLLVEWDEQAFGAYLTDQRNPRTRLEGYVLHKTERNDYRAPTHRQFHADRSFEIAGARAAHTVGRGWSFTGELAGEWGRLSAENIPIRAWGGYGYAKKTWTAPWKPALQLGYIAMSGDNPDTATIEEWHPAFARWPKWSEIYIQSLSQERGPAYWANLGMYQAEATVAPAKQIGLRLTYFKLGAFHPFAGSPAVFGPGTNRGQLVQARVDLTLNNSLRGHVLYEALWPGDFTREMSRGYFFRTELIYTFRKNPGR